MSDKPKGPAAPAQPADFLAVFTAATPDDLDRIRADVAARERELDGLRAIEKALDVKLNGAPIRAARRAKKPGAGPARPAPAPPTDSPGDSVGLFEKRKRVLLYLKANGSKPLDAVGEKCGISKYGRDCLAVVTKHEWFHVTPEGVLSLTDKGDRAYPGA